MRHTHAPSCSRHQPGPETHEIALLNTYFGLNSFVYPFQPHQGFPPFVLTSMPNYYLPLPSHPLFSPFYPAAWIWCPHETGFLFHNTQDRKDLLAWQICLWHNRTPALVPSILSAARAIGIQYIMDCLGQSRKHRVVPCRELSWRVDKVSCRLDLSMPRRRGRGYWRSWGGSLVVVRQLWVLLHWLDGVGIDGGE